MEGGVTGRVSAENGEEKNEEEIGEEEEETESENAEAESEHAETNQAEQHGEGREGRPGRFLTYKEWREANAQIVEQEYLQSLAPRQCPRAVRVVERAAPEHAASRPNADAEPAVSSEVVHTPQPAFVQLPLQTETFTQLPLQSENNQFCTNTLNCATVAVHSVPQFFPSERWEANRMQRGGNTWGARK